MRSGATLSAVVLALSSAACGSTTARHATTSATAKTLGHRAANGALAFARCMRSHGVNRFPDPQSANEAKYPGAQQLGVSAPVYRTAREHCQGLLPASAGGSFSRAELQVLLAGMLRFSRCMRSHGVPHWPDPSVGPQGRPGYNLLSVPGLNANAPQTLRATHSCGHLEPSALGGVPVRQA